jgi:predicted amidohydrolase
MKAACRVTTPPFLITCLLSLAALAIETENPSQRPAKPGTVRVAGIVLKWLRGDKETNYARIEPLIREAASNGAQIVCTTECFYDGYAMADKSIPLEEYRALGEPIPGGKYFENLCRLSKELNIHLIAGMLEANGEARYNTAVTIGPDGKLLAKYHKQKLEHESIRNTPGTDSSVLKSSYGNLGVMICADRRFPEVVKKFTEAGADFLLCPSGGMFGPKSNDHIVQARSRENRKYIIFVHPAEFLVTSPSGEIVAQTILGNSLLISKEQIGSEADSKKVFYFDLPLGSKR